jgi:hypothetical protein
VVPIAAEGTISHVRPARVCERPLTPPEGPFPRRLLAVALSAVFVALLVAVSVGHGPVVTVDLTVHHALADRIGPASRLTLEALVGLGLRGAVSGPALLYAAWLSWRDRTWRPLLVMASALLALNVTVGSAKLLSGRLAPHDGAPTMFAGGTEFPAGHASNAVLTWGTVLWLQQRYDRSRLSAAAGRAAVLTIGGVVGVGCLLLDTHWTSDVVAGWAAGSLLLLALPLSDRVAMAPVVAWWLAVPAGSAQVHAEPVLVVRRGRVGAQSPVGRVRP